MKSLIVKILKMSLILLLAALLLALLFGLVLLIGWPWWVGVFLIFGLVGLVLGVIFVRKLVTRKSEQRFVRQVIAQDESRIKGMAAGDRDGFRDLQDQWKHAIDALRKSHLKKFGNPLYVLPWYMIIGESGCGKTTAVKGADLSSPFADVTRTSGISGTRNCDWWFFEQAIIIDTAGRYAIPVDQGRDRDEWQKFLAMLARFRKREPLNGLVVAVAADRLLEKTSGELEQDGQRIRRRVDELMRVLGAKFPIYVMVTKCDLIQGALTFCDQLDESALQQAMGRMNDSASGDTSAFFSQAIPSVVERLKDLRRQMINLGDGATHKKEASLLMFPKEFEKLQPGFDVFMRGAFQENPYQEAPILRGIYFSSGKQEGTPYSHFLRAMGLIGEKDILPGTNRGLFLHDFFSRVLPSDRGLFAPTQKRLAWSRLTRSMGLTAWVAVVIAACGLLSFAFVKNLKTLRDVSGQFSRPPVLQGDLTTDVLMLDHFQEAVSKIADQNDNWWIPRLGLKESIRVEAALKKRFCDIFRAGFLVDFDQRMAERMTGFSDATAPDVVGRHAMHLARRINLLHRRMETNNRDDLAALPAAAYPAVLLGTPAIDEISQKISDLYLYYLLWRANDTSLNDELKMLQTWLKHVLTLEDARLNWLVNWVAVNADLPAVNMADFWRGMNADAKGATVLPAFTVRGKAAIESAVGEIEMALFDPLVIGSRKLDFFKWYHERVLTSWRDFAAAFTGGPQRLADRDAWKQAGMIMSTDQGPYQALLDTMAGELVHYKNDENRPAWVDLVYQFKSLKTQARIAGRDTDPEPGILKKATQSVSSRLSRMETATGSHEADNLDFETQMEAGKAYNQYRDALAAMMPMIESRKVAFKMATDLYGEDPAKGESPFFAAWEGQRRLHMVLGGNRRNSEVFWDLISGPSRFYHDFAAREAECQLQQLWEKDVFLEVQNVPHDTNVNQLLMGTNGYALAFLKGPAQPFIARSLSKGYYARQVDGKALNLNTGFLTFLTRGANAAKPVATEYLVSVRAYPTNANRSAAVKPHATVLELHCGDKKNKLTNLHYPVKKTFRWSPQTCGDVIFTIEIENLELTTVYSGYLGFARFLEDFKTGQRTFRPHDFPDQAASLKRMGVTSITPRYRFSGHKEVVQLLREAPGRVPQEITSCWGE